MPDWKRYLREHLDLPAMEGHRDERAIEEMADHLEDLYRELLSRGVPEAEAEAMVVEWLGDPRRAAAELIRAEPHHARARVDRWVERREEVMRARGSFRSSLADGVRDLRLGVRSLARRPLFAVVVILVLALGIGGTSAIFTLVDGIVLSPLPFSDADRLVAVQHTAPEKGIGNAGQCAAWHFTYVDESRVFDALGMFTTGTVTVTGNGPPEAVPVLGVTDGVFQAARLAAVAGRTFTADDMDPATPPTVMLGRDYWRSRFGGDPAAIGQTLQVNGFTMEIIGVAPGDVRALGVPEPSLVLPLQYNRSSLFVGNIGFGSVGRLAEGVSIEAAAADLNRVLPLAWEKFPGGPVASSSDPGQWVAEVRPLKEVVVGSVGTTLWVLLAGVGVLLLIACANVANLYLVRAEGKEGEMAVRAAMGASVRRIGWEYMKESLLLGLMGGAAGLALARVGLASLLALTPTNLPRAEEVSLDTRVLLFTLAVSLVAGLLFGLIPALRHRRASPVASLKEGGDRGTQGRGRYRAQNLLAVSQIALALVLLVASGLMLRSFQMLRNVDPGFRSPENVVTVRLNIPFQEVPANADVAAMYEAIVHGIEAIPGVSSVGLATAIPMDGSNNWNPFYVRDPEYAAAARGVTRRHKWIAEGYLESLQIPLLAGRSFTWEDVRNRAPLAMLSERLAREVFGSPEAAIGRYVAARPDPPVWKEVIGVVKDVREDGLTDDPPLLVYWPHATLGFWEGNAANQVQVWRAAGIAIRSDRVGTPGFLRELEQAIWDVSPNLPLRRVRTLPELMDASVARTSFTMVLLGIAGVVALILGLVGVYGVISYAVGQRTRELGMRMALGAGRSQVTAMVVRQGAALAAVGVILGLALALGVTRLMSALLFDVSPADPATFGTVAAGLVAVALLASYLPARRAARVDPVVALRAE